MRAIFPSSTNNAPSTIKSGNASRAFRKRILFDIRLLHQISPPHSSTKRAARRRFPTHATRSSDSSDKKQPLAPVRRSPVGRKLRRRQSPRVRPPFRASEGPICGQMNCGGVWGTQPETTICNRTTTLRAQIGARLRSQRLPAFIAFASRHGSRVQYTLLRYYVTPPFRRARPLLIVLLQ